MNYEQALLEDIRKIVSPLEDVAQIAANLAIVALPKSTNLSINAQILTDYIREFQFGWDNESFVDREKFAAETKDKIVQFMTDISAGNQYTRIFSSELAYSRLIGGDYSYKVVAKTMLAKTVDEAVKENIEIRAAAPQQHPQDKDYVLEDVRLRVKIVDQNGKTVLGERFLQN